MSAGPLTSFDFGGGPSPVLTAPVPQFPDDVPPELARRFRESYDWFNYGGYPTGGPGWAQFDGAPNLPAGWGRGASGTVGDRRGGKDLPQFWSELDLRGYRTMSRWLWETNPFMIGFGRALTDYHIGKGWQWQACRKGQKKQAYATGAAGADPLTVKVQNILDGWRDRVNWPLRSREGFRRLHRDGEVIQRFGRGGRGELPWVRWVNSEQVGSPTGDTSEEESYGLRSAVRDGQVDGEHATHVYVRDHDGDGTAGEWLLCDRDDPAARVLFFKTNTDADVKRGLPDSFSVHEPMDEARKCVRNMGIVAAAQAAIAWREKFPTATAEQVRAQIPTGAPRIDPPAWANGTGQTVYSEKLAAGSVLRTEGSREFEPGPVQTGVPNYVEAVQAALRMACVRWGFPPYLTAKADDINFASSLTAGSPFAVAIEGGQIEWGTVERATALKVLDLAVESGLLTWEERRLVDVEVIAPTVTSPDKKADTDRLTALVDKKLIDPYTAQQELGYDPSHIEANWKAWTKRNDPAASGGSGDGGGQDLKGTVGGLQAIQQMQTAFYAGQIPREAAVSAMHILFGFAPADAEKLFPDVKPVDKTADGQGPDGTDPFGIVPAPPSLESVVAEAVRRVLAGLSAERVRESAPGPPPRPGLVWNDTTHRWTHPQTGKEHPPEPGAGLSVGPAE